MVQEARKQVYIVDDSPIVRDRLVRMLADVPDVEVVGQADIAFEAIYSIRKLKPDVVVLDISMPGGSGISVLETIKQDKTGPQIIMLTNFAYDQYRQRCAQLGADYFFDKSTEFDKVLGVLRGLEPGRPAPEAPAASVGFSI